MLAKVRALSDTHTNRNRLGEEQEGVRQDCILSPTLFSLYTEELAARMRRINAGVRVRNDKISVLLYAEDVVVMSESVDQLQSLLDVMIDHGRDSELQFSSEKSKVMIVKRSEDKSNAV